MNKDKQDQAENSHEDIAAEDNIESIVDALDDSGLSELEIALATATADLEKHKDALLRQQAEVQNSRTRAAREIDKARKFALDAFMKELLPVYDTFARGLEAENVTPEGLREGSELTLKMFSKALEKFGLEAINPEGEVFNPDLHEAVGMVPMEGFDSGSIIEVIQKGYKLNDRLIRAAMVIVAQ